MVETTELKQLFDPAGNDAVVLSAHAFRVCA